MTTSEILCGAVRSDQPDLPCVLEHNATIHEDEHGDTWRTVLPPPPMPALTVVRQRCRAALTAAQARDRGESYDERALAAAVPDIPILLNAVERLGRAVASLTAESMHTDAAQKAAPVEVVSDD